MMMFYALVTLCFFSSARAQIVGWGPCPNMAPMPNFSLPQMAGRWYEASRYFAVNAFSAKCVVFDYRVGENGTMIVNSSVISSLNGHQYNTPEAVVRSPYASDPGMLKFRIPALNIAVPMSFLILGTDYDSYKVDYLCINLELAHLTLLSVGTRAKEPSKGILKKAIKVIKKHKLNPKLLMKTDQKDCEVEPFEMETTEEHTSTPKICRCETP